MTATVPTGNAQALLDAGNAAGADKSNQLAIQAARLDDVKKIGELAAEGVLSLTDLAIKFAGWVKDKTFSEEHAGVIYSAYVEGYNAKVTASAIGGAGELLEATKQSISIFKTFGREAVKLYGDTWFGRVAKIAAEVNGKLGKGDTRLSVYNSLVRANRKLSDGWSKAEKAGQTFPVFCKAEVSEEAIAEWITPKAKDPKADETVLAEAVKALGKASEREGLNADLAAHVAAEVAKLNAILDRAKAGTLKPLSSLIKAGPKLTPAEIKAQIEAA